MPREPGAYAEIGGRFPERAAAGLYFYELQAAGGTQTRRLVLVALITDHPPRLRPGNALAASIDREH